MIVTITDEGIRCDKGGGMVTVIADTQENRIKLGLEEAEPAAERDEDTEEE